MSQNIVEIKQNNSISKDSFSKKEIIADRNVTYPKVSSGTKRIDYLITFIFNCDSLYFLCLFITIKKFKDIS